MGMGMRVGMRMGMRMGMGMGMFGYASRDRTLVKPRDVRAVLCFGVRPEPSEAHGSTNRVVTKCGIFGSVLGHLLVQSLAPAAARPHEPQSPPQPSHAEQTPLLPLVILQK